MGACPLLKVKLPKPKRIDSVTAFNDLIAGKKDLFLQLAVDFIQQVKGIIWIKEDDDFYQYSEGCYYKLHDSDIDGLLISKEFPQGKDLTTNGRKTVVTNIKTLCRHSLEEFNPEGFINFQNGIFSFKDRKLMPHSKEFYSTIQLPYDHDSQAQCFLWKKSVEEIMDSDNNKIRTLKEFMGYCLNKSTKQQKALFLLSDADHGKTVLLETIRNMMGVENCSSLSLKYFNNPMLIPTMINKSVNISDELPKRCEDYENEFKRIVTGGMIHVNPKHVAGYDVLFYCKLIFAANELPHIDDSTDGFYKRMLILNLTRRFLPEEQDRDLTEKLKLELSGIFNWALEGYDALNVRGCFVIDEYMKKLINTIKTSNNPILEFIDENIVIDKSSELVKGVAYDVYYRWILKNGYKPMGINKFSAEIFKHFKTVTKKDGKETIGEQRRCWPNLALRGQSLNGQQVTDWNS